MGSDGSRPGIGLALDVGPRKVQSQWSLPLENDHRPESRKPPDTRRAVRGAYGELIRVLVFSPQTSAWARSSYIARWKAWMPTTPSTQPTDGSASASVAVTSKDSIGVVSNPPWRAGCSIWKKPASCMSAMVSSRIRSCSHW